MAISTTFPNRAVTRSRTRGRRIGLVLWIVQGLLAAVFLMTGVMKLALPMDMLMAQMQLPLPGLFVRFLGLCELAGSLGLILPRVTHIRPSLTPLAASCLVVLMACAAAITLATGGGAEAVLPMLVGLLAGYVAYGRTRLAS